MRYGELPKTLKGHKFMMVFHDVNGFQTGVQITEMANTAYGDHTLHIGSKINGGTHLVSGFGFETICGTQYFVIHYRKQRGF